MLGLVSEKSVPLLRFSITTGYRPECDLKCNEED